MNRLLIPLVAALLAALPASAQDPSKARLDKSPRHQEWVKVKQGARGCELLPGLSRGQGQGDGCRRDP